VRRRGRSGSAAGGGGRLPVAPRLPQGLLARIRAAAEDEEQVREAAEVAHDLGVAVLDLDRAALGAAAHGPADVEVRGGLRTPREDERPQRRERRVDLVARL